MIDEGYIKFNIHWKKSTLPDFLCIPDLIKWRNKMFDLSLIGHYPDLDVGYGNISHLTDSGFVISGTQTGEIEKISAQEFTFVNQYDIEGNELWCEGPVKASSESLTHAAVYECNPSIRAIIHIHDKKLWDQHIDQIPTSKRDVPYGTVEMAHEIKRLYREFNMKDQGLFVMGGHDEGIISFGPDLDTAGQLIHDLLN